MKLTCAFPVLLLPALALVAGAAPASRLDPDSRLLARAPNPPRIPGTAVAGSSAAGYAAQLRLAILGEEHAWLKTHGYADIDKGLRITPYPERKYPRHADDDLLPLPTLLLEPKLNGQGGDPAWLSASRGVVRVARIGEWEQGPLVEQAVEAGVCGSSLCLAVTANRFLSSHLAMVGVINQTERGLIVLSGNTLEWRPLDAKGVAGEARAIPGAYRADASRMEARLPLAWFPGYDKQGLYVSAGIGGRWTAPGGRPVNFFPAPFAVRQEGDFDGSAFPLRITVLAPRKQIAIANDADAMRTEIQNLTPDAAVQELRIIARQGQLGPEAVVTFSESTGQPWRLTMFRYVAARRALTLFRELIERRATAGQNVAEPRARLAAFSFQAQALLEAARPDPAAERALLWDVCAAKRALFLHDESLRAVAKLLFSKRHPFHPSHNYSVQFDSPWRPGGGVWSLAIPMENGTLQPERSRPVRLFDSGAGVTRDPSLSFDAKKIYFGHRSDAKEYYRIYEQDVATGARRRISLEGPFHDFWPTPLPDGGLAFITTRCRKKFICWRPQAAVLYRMELDGSKVEPISYANLTEFAPSVLDDGRLLWTRSEYADKGADYGHTLWTIRPDGTYPDLTFGNTIALPQGYANGRQVPGTKEVSAVMISHFGDLNGPVALIDLAKGPHDPSAIRSITPEIPWPGFSPNSEAFREPVPISRDVLLVAHAPQDRFGLFLIDRYGNRELLYIDSEIDSICPLPFRPRPVPPVIRGVISPKLAEADKGHFFIQDVYRGLEGKVERGAARYLRICEEVSSPLRQMPDGTYQADHEPFQQWYASPVDRVSGAWPSYVAKGVVGTVPIESDGSASFLAPAGRVLYFELLDADYNEIQRMRSVAQVRPGERRSCIGCHESRLLVPGLAHAVTEAMKKAPVEPVPPPWGAGPFWFERVVQPVLDARCTSCHNALTPNKLDLSDVRDRDHVPASYRNLIRSGTLNFFDFGYQAGVPYKAAPYSFGTVKSRLFQILADEHHRDVRLTAHQQQAIKCWIDLNVPLWGDYAFRPERQTVRPQDQGRWQPD
jgi:hypothetical protein